MDLVFIFPHFSPFYHNIEIATMRPMLSYIKGILISASPIRAVVEAGGLGYLIFVPLHAHAQMPPHGKEIFLHLSVVIREDAHQLYGFLTEEERDLFQQLHSVSGIGPKIALSLIGHLPYTDLCTAITHSDTTALCAIPGVGKKTAERLIIDLKDKIKSTAPSSSISAAQKSTVSDAIQALTHLGYKQAQAQKAVQNALNSSEDPLSLSKLITLSLRHI